MRFSKFMGVATVLWVIACSSASANSPVGSDDQQALKLLNNAVEYYRVQGDSALAAFSRQGEFVDGEHYVFVVDTHGTMLASVRSWPFATGRHSYVRWSSRWQKMTAQWRYRWVVKSV